MSHAHLQCCTVKMNAQHQADEVEALRAIYDDSFRTISEEQSSHVVCVGAEDGSLSVELMVTFPADYPSDSPPVYEIRSAPPLDGSGLAYIDKHFQQIFRESGGEVVVYQWVEWLREWLTERALANKAVEHYHKDCPEDVHIHEREVIEEVSKTRGGSSIQCPDIAHGEPLTDRRSTFQAHLARVTTTEQVKAVLTELKENRKIATATHNIMAYRIHHSERGVYQQDCDDDGEAAAGGRLLHLLQIMDARDVVVVVTRWYGGILLHADRFKHINNVARTLIQDTGLGLEHKASAQGNAKDKKHCKPPHKSKGGKHR